MIDDAVPTKYKGLIHRVKTLKSNSKADAIKAFCLECVGFKFKRVTNCTAPTCALFNVRPYQVKEGSSSDTE